MSTQGVSNLEQIAGAALLVAKIIRRRPATS